MQSAPNRYAIFHAPRPRSALLTAALCTSLAVGALAQSAPARPAAPPVAPVRPVVDTLFDTTIVDPYRWMETPGDSGFDAWMRAENDYARAILERLPNRAEIGARLRALYDADVEVSDVQRYGGRYFYLKTEPGQEVELLYTRVGLSGRERILVDPARLGTDTTTHMAIDYFFPSNDGRYVAVGLSPGGSEESVLHVFESATGRDLGERIDRAQFSTVSWRDDGRAFYYTRLQQRGPGASPTDKYKRARNYLHVLGTDPERDTAVLGYGLSPAVAAGEDDFPVVYASPASPYALGVLYHGTASEFTMYVVRTDAIAGSSTPWRMLTDTADAVTNAAVHGDDVYLLTHRDAPRYKVVRTSLSRPDLANAVVVVPPSKAVVANMFEASDALYVQKLDGGLGRLERLPYDHNAATPQPIALPFDGSIPMVATNQTEPGALLRFESWTRSPRWLEYRPDTKQLRDTRIEPPSKVDYSDIVSTEVMVKSADGTMIPLSIIHKRGLALDGSNPTWLSAYGAYGISMDPNYAAPRLAWFERGGVRAIAHVRGGGEYGEEWHLAGKQATKQNTVDDLLACAKYLIDHGYTSPARLAVNGGSAGGIAAGRAITQRPDLFGAAVMEVGVFNMLRMEFSEGGPFNIPEYGSVTTQAGFRALLGMDSYHNVRAGTKYPAVLLTTGINDPRVVPWQVGKMAARLQASTASGKPVLLRVDYDAGHGYGSTKTQRMEEHADEMAFLFWQLGAPTKSSAGTPP
jgi:prolyl oligopeptidase